MSKKFMILSIFLATLKKNKGYQRSVEMCKDYDIYRQCYCGCIFGAKDQGINLLQIKKDAKAFVSDKDGKEEFPNIRFTFNGKSM